MLGLLAGLAGFAAGWSAWSLSRRRLRGPWAPLLSVLQIAVLAGGAIFLLAQPRKPAHIVLICVDTWRADHVSFNGYDRSTSPTLDGLAATEGVVFENVYASSSWTLPSVMSVFTSLQPPQHGVEDRGSRLPDGATTLAESLADGGWLTSAFVTHIYVSSLFGFDQGFVEFRELSIDWEYREGKQLRANQLNQRVLPWLAHHADSKFFLYLHYFDPHWDYDPPPPFREHFADPGYTGPADGTWGFLRQFLPRDRLMNSADLHQTIDLYDGEVLWTDSQLALLFDAMKALGIWDDSLIVVFGDHGEEFQEHGSVHHIRTLYDEVLRVPLIVKLPGGRLPGVRPRIPERVRLLDVAPTLMDLAGLPLSAEMAGTSVAPLLKTPGVDRDVFARTVRHDANRIAQITGRWKIIFNYGEDHSAFELYDLLSDPRERVSVAYEMSEVASEMARNAAGQLDSMRQWNRKHLEPSGAVVLTSEQEEHLKRLGYIE